jgi:hypothetical protein
MYATKFDQIHGKHQNQSTQTSNFISAMRVVVMTVAGRKYELDIDPAMEAVVIKDRIHQEEGISSEQQRLLFRGQELPNSQTFEAAGVCDNDIIHMTVSLRAGGVNERATGTSSDAAAEDLGWNICQMVMLCAGMWLMYWVERWYLWAALGRSPRNRHSLVGVRGAPCVAVSDTTLYWGNQCASGRSSNGRQG